MIYIRLHLTYLPGSMEVVLVLHYIPTHIDKVPTKNTRKRTQPAAEEKRRK